MIGLRFLFSISRFFSVGCGFRRVLACEVLVLSSFVNARRGSV